MSTPSELAADRAACNMATEGPWMQAQGDDEHCSSISGVLSVAEYQRALDPGRQQHRGDFPEDTRWIMVDPGPAPVTLADEDNEAFMVRARSRYPLLVEEVAALSARIEAARKLAKYHIDTMDGSRLSEDDGAHARDMVDDMLEEIIEALNGETK